MKKQFLLTASLGIISMACIKAQSLAGTNLQSRQAVMEIFTGIHCNGCPDGERKAEILYNKYPGKVNIIAIHAKGYYGTPQNASEPDFRNSTYGPAFETFSGLTGYPEAMMNRVAWPQFHPLGPNSFYPVSPPNGLAIGPNGWWPNLYPGKSTGDYIINDGGTSPVNIGVTTAWNNSTRKLTVNVELYYTSAQSSNNELNVVFTESGVVGWQTDNSVPNPNYVHNHIFRDMINGQYGEQITGITQGKLVNSTYTYTLPANYNGIVPNIDKCQVTVFVTESASGNHRIIHTGITAQAKNGTASTKTASSVGIEENLFENFFIISPNPNNGLFELKFNSVVNADYRIRLANEIGQIVYSQAISAVAEQTLKSIDISAFSKGIYFLSVSGNKENVMRKIIVY